MTRLGAFHCLAPDLPGFGQSNHLPPASLREIADLVAALIETRVRRGGRTSSASPGAARSSTPCWTAIPISSTGRSSMARPRSSRREEPDSSWSCC